MILCSTVGCPEPGIVLVDVPSAQTSPGRPHAMRFCKEHAATPDWPTAQTRNTDTKPPHWPVG